MTTDEVVMSNTTQNNRDKDNERIGSGIPCIQGIGGYVDIKLKGSDTCTRVPIYVNPCVHAPGGYVDIEVNGRMQKMYIGFKCLDVNMDMTTDKTKN